MPGFITHYIGGQSALESVSPEIRSYITPMSPLFNLGTQGPDIFFYYVPGFIIKRVRGVGTQMHNEGLGLFVTHIADILKQSKSPAKRRIVFAYAAGFLAHYALDVHTHPYVFSQTHNPPLPKIKEAARHRHFETSIDVLMLSRFYNRQPSDCKLWRLISPKKLYMRVAAEAASTAIREVYCRNIYPWDIYRAMSQMVILTKHLQSKCGRRKHLMQRVEGITIGSHIVSSLIHMQGVTDNCDYLNIKEAPWSAPWLPEKTHTESFLELFESAVKDAAQMMQTLYAYMHDHISKDQLMAIITNRSLKTGQAIPNQKTGFDANDKGFRQPGQNP